MDELLIKLSEFIEAKRNKTPAASDKENNYLTRFEVSKILKISLPTLTTYTKEGKLQSYKIGNRVLYKSEEVDQAIQKLSTYKQKKASEIHKILMNKSGLKNQFFSYNF